MLRTPFMKRPPQSKAEHLRRLVSGKNDWSEPLSEAAKAKGFKGWHERGYLPHCDKPGLIQFVTFRLWDSLPASRRGEWEHLLAITERSDAPRSVLSGDAPHAGTRSIVPLEPTKAEARAQAARENRRKLEAYLDRNHGECLLRDPHVAEFMERTMRFHHGQRFDLLAWVVMPNHVHALFKVGDSTPLSAIMQNWKSISAVAANKLLNRSGEFWQEDYWDTFMRDEEQTRKAIRYIENNPVKAKLCRTPEEWPFGSARFRDPQTWELKL
jgi:REP element-mobilizing transposase RayT